MSAPRPIGVVLHDLSGGGTERIAVRLAHGWQKLGRRAVLLCGDARGPLAELAQGLPIAAPDRPIRRGLGSRRRLAQWVEDEARQQDLGALFVPGNYHFPLLDRLGTKDPDRPRLVAKLSNTIDRQRQFDRFRPYWRDRMARRLRAADAVVAMSPALAEEALRMLGPLPLFVVPEPILDDRFELPDLTRPRSGIVAAGRFEPQKNFGLLLDAMRAVDAALTIAGDGPEWAPLAQVAARDLAGRVTLPGRLPDIGPLLRQARLFVLSSRFEGYPAVLIEALAHGCRLVATDCSPAVREIISDPAIGEIVPRDDAAALAAAILRQLDFAPPPASAMARMVAEHRLARAATHYLDLFDRP